jgi:S-formylglutathione hydrolase FrmB
MGWSMGGYGALHLGAKLGPSRTAGICAISPALYTSFTGSAPGAFDSYDDWVQNSVTGLPALSQIPLKSLRRAAFRTEGTTWIIGARKCPASWPGWRPRQG